ncbi:60S ribosomal subunit assembly or modification protein [Lecanora helva]
MESSNKSHEGQEPTEDDSALLDATEAAEEVPEDPDQPMDSDADDDVPDIEIELQNDSLAYFDGHTDSIFAIAQHPSDPSIIATGGGDDTTRIFSIDSVSPVLPTSYESNPKPERPSLEPIATLKGHTDSVNTLSFTLPNGDFLMTGGLDGHLRIHSTSETSYPLIAEAQELEKDEEINFLSPCPNPAYPNTFALGASNGSVWVYTIDAEDKTSPLQILQTYFLHTASCTAGAWTSDGKMLATVSEDGSFYVWDVFGEASAAGVVGAAGSQAVVGLTTEDQRFAVEGGLFSVAIAPGGAFAVVGGAGGMIRVVGLPRLGAAAPTSATQGLKGGGSKNKSGGGRKAGGAEGASAGQAGQILASLQAQSDSIETLAFSAPPLTLLAAGSVDGSIALFDTAHRFAVRRHIREAHEEFAVVKVEFAPSPNGHLLTSCGFDGVVRRWDTRGGTAASGQGLLREWRGHRGEGEKGGVLGFVQGGGKKIVTAGDDGVNLVFDAAA